MVGLPSLGITLLFYSYVSTSGVGSLRGRKGFVGTSGIPTAGRVVVVPSTADLRSYCSVDRIPQDTPGYTAIPIKVGDMVTRNKRKPCSNSDDRPLIAARHGTQQGYCAVLHDDKVRSRGVLAFEPGCVLQVDGVRPRV